MPLRINSALSKFEEVFVFSLPSSKFKRGICFVSLVSYFPALGNADVRRPKPCHRQHMPHGNMCCHNEDIEKILATKTPRNADFGGSNDLRLDLDLSAVSELA